MQSNFTALSALSVVSSRLPLRVGFLRPTFRRELLQPLCRSPHSAPFSGAAHAGPFVNPDPPRPSPPRHVCVRHIILSASSIRHLSWRSSPHRGHFALSPLLRARVPLALSSPQALLSIFCALFPAALSLCASFLLFPRFLTVLLVMNLVFLIPSLVLFLVFFILALHALLTPLQLLLFLSPLHLLHTLLIVRVPPLVLLLLHFMVPVPHLFARPFVPTTSYHCQSRLKSAIRASRHSLSPVRCPLSSSFCRCCLIVAHCLSSCACTSNFVVFVRLVFSPSSSYLLSLLHAFFVVLVLLWSVSSSLLFFVLSFTSISMFPFVPVFSFAFVSFHLDPVHTFQRSHQPHVHTLRSCMTSSKVWTSCELARIRTTTSCASSSSFYWLHCSWSSSLLCPCSASSSIVNLTCCFCLVRTVSAPLFASSN